MMMIGGGVMFTLISVVAWVTQRRVAAVVMAVIAGLDFAFAISLLSR
jgi:hypothetical protein